MMSTSTGGGSQWDIFVAASETSVSATDFVSQCLHWIDHPLPADAGECVLAHTGYREVAPSVGGVCPHEPLRVLVTPGIGDQVEDEPLEPVRVHDGPL